MSLGAELEAAWKRWDRQPGALESVEAFEDAARRAAAEVGEPSTSVFRARLAGLLQEGMSHRQAIEHLGVA